MITTNGCYWILQFMHVPHQFMNYCKLLKKWYSRYKYCIYLISSVHTVVYVRQKTVWLGNLRAKRSMLLIAQLEVIFIIGKPRLRQISLATALGWPLAEKQDYLLRVHFQRVPSIILVLERWLFKVLFVIGILPINTSSTQQFFLLIGGVRCENGKCSALITNNFNKTVKSVAILLQLPDTLILVRIKSVIYLSQLLYAT